MSLAGRAQAFHPSDWRRVREPCTASTRCSCRSAVSHNGTPTNTGKQYFRSRKHSAYGDRVAWAIPDQRATIPGIVSGFGIFQRGGFNEAHLMGVLTLVVVGMALLPLRMRWWPYAQTVLWALTLLFHMVPGMTETFTRPLDAPLFTGPDDPTLPAAVGGMFGVFAVVMLLQVLHRRRQAQPSISSIRSIA